MKIYIKNINFNDIDLTSIESYKYKSSNIKYIISENGIINYCNEKLIKIKIIDEPCYEEKVNNIIFICDNSRFIKDRQVYQIPVKHYIENIHSDSYVLRSNSNISFIVEYKENSIYNIYFSTSESININYIQDDINTFLRKIKYIK